jgi:pilus assembly protein Flp/PilA
MAKFLVGVKKFFKREQAPTMTEYAIMVALIAVACIAVVKALGQEISSVFSTISSSLAGTI